MVLREYSVYLPFLVYLTPLLKFQGRGLTHFQAWGLTGFRGYDRMDMFFESRGNYKLDLSDDSNGSQNGQLHFCAVLNGAERRGSMRVQTQHQKLVAGTATQLRDINQANDTGMILLMTAADSGDGTLIGARS